MPRIGNDKFIITHIMYISNIGMHSVIITFCDDNKSKYMFRNNKDTHILTVLYQASLYQSLYMTKERNNMHPIIYSDVMMIG